MRFGTPDSQTVFMIEMPAVRQDNLTFFDVAADQAYFVFFVLALQRVEESPSCNLYDNFSAGRRDSIRVRTYLCKHTAL